MSTTKKETQRIIQTQRDREMIKFFNKGMMATSAMMDTLFFHSPVSCRRRLVRMYEMGWLSRQRADESLPFVYFKKEASEDPLTDQEQRELTKEEETRQNKRLYLTQCFIQFTKLDARVVHFEINKALVNSVADLMVVLDYKDHQVLVICDLYNRDGQTKRHQSFLNQSMLLQQLQRKFQIKRVIHLIYAERLDEEASQTLFIKRPSHLSYRDYKQIDWTEAMDFLNQGLHYAFD